MEIVRATVLGFCFGVRRAIDLAEAALRKEATVNTLGPLVHNSQEIQRLADAGIRAVDTPDDVTSRTVVIRAHGACPQTFERLRQRHIVDATCPFVTKSQRIAQHFTSQGYTLVIVGHPDHPEVQGILGYIATPAYVILTPEEVDGLPANITPGVIAQTTVNERTFQQVVEAIGRRYPDYIVQNTVCFATRERQQASRELAGSVDAIYVVGGRHSSNANRLAEVCKAECPRTFLIEVADEINPEDLAGVERVGVTAGASTPDWLIADVVARLEAIARQRDSA